MKYTCFCLIPSIHLFEINCRNIHKTFEFFPNTDIRSCIIIVTILIRENKTGTQLQRYFVTIIAKSNKVVYSHMKMHNLYFFNILNARLSEILYTVFTNKVEKMHLNLWIYNVIIYVCSKDAGKFPTHDHLLFNSVPRFRQNRRVFDKI